MNRASTGSVKAKDFAFKRVAMSFLGSLAIVGSTLTAEPVASFASSNGHTSPGLSLISPHSAADWRELKPGRIGLLFADNSANAGISAAFFCRQRKHFRKLRVVSSLQFYFAFTSQKSRMTQKIRT